MSFSILLLFILTSIYDTTAQRNCTDLQYPNTLVDGDVITFTEDCIINASSIITIDGIHLTIDGQNKAIDFITNQQHVFHITNGATLNIQNIDILSPTKYITPNITSIFYLSNNASLILDSVHFKNNIGNSNDYLYTQYVIYSPSSDLSSSITIQQSSFQSAFAVQQDAIYMIGTENEDDECPSTNPCCTSHISITDTLFDDISQSFLTAYCSEITIRNTNITHNIMHTAINNNAKDDCLFCFGYNTVTNMHNNIFDNNEGIMIYSPYYGAEKKTNDYIFTLNIDQNTITNHQNTAIVLRSHTTYASQITLSNMLIEQSVFGTDGLFVLHPNTNANIHIMNTSIVENNGVLISAHDSVMDEDLFDHCLDAYDATETGGIWITDTIISNNNVSNGSMFDIQYQRLSLTGVTFTNNKWLTETPFYVTASSLFVSDAIIHSNSDDSFDEIFTFDNAQSLCFTPDFMSYAFGVNAADFSIDDLFTFTNTITEVKGVGISDIELNNCDTNTILDPISVQYLKLSRFNATNCAILSTNISREDDGVSIDFHDGVFRNSSLFLNLHLNDRISFKNCHFYDSSMQLSSGLLSDETIANVTYGTIETNVVIENCQFEGYLSTEMITIHAQDEWLPSITFSNTEFHDLSRDSDNYKNPLILISTQMIGNIDFNETNDLLPFGRGAIEFIECTFTQIDAHILTVIDEAIYSNDAPISRIMFQQCKFQQLTTNILHDEFKKQAAIKFDFRYNEFYDISAITDNTDVAVLHFHGFECEHTESQLLDNDISFNQDVFQSIHADRALIHSSCVNLGLNEVLMHNNTANIAYGVSVTKSNLLVSSVTMSNNSNSIYGGIYCYTETGDLTSCYLQISSSSFIGNQAIYGGVISFKTSHETITEYTIINMYDVQFIDNTATDFGGAIFIEDVMDIKNNRTLKLNDVDFYNNQAIIGGALYIKESALDCKHCVFSNNTATQYGGAMMLQSDICLDDTLMANIRAYPKVILQKGTTFTHNNALIGGGIASICNDLYTFDVLYTNNGNYFTDRGGAIFAHKTCLRSVENNTFTRNSAQFGASIAVSAPLALKCPNNITQNTFANNTGIEQTGAILITTSFIDVDEYNLVSHNQFNLTFHEEWFETTDHTSWSFEIYGNIFDSNSGGHSGAAILISPADFVGAISSALDASNHTNDTDDHLIDIHSHNVVDHYFVYIFNNTFINNEIHDDGSANNHGGGAIAWLLEANSTASMNISFCNFIENTGYNGQGGALWTSCYDCISAEYAFEHYTASFNISRENACEFCSYEEYHTNRVSLVISDLYFVNNNAIAGGAIAITCIGSVTISNIEFKNHYAEFYGGSIYLHQIGSVMMDYIVIEETSTEIDGYTDSKGGAIYGSCILDDIVIANTDISSAESVIGGAIFLYETPSVKVEKSVFTHNAATLAGGCLAIFTPGTNDRSITITNVDFTETLGSFFGSTIYIGSYRDIIILFDGHSSDIRDDSYPPLLDVWDFEFISKRRIYKSTQKDFEFASTKFATGQLLNAARIVVDIDIEDPYAQFTNTPKWNETDMLLYDAQGTLQASIDFERSFGNVVFLKDAYFEDVAEIIEDHEAIVLTVYDDYTFVFDGDHWLDALDKNTTKNVTFRYDMIAFIENKWSDDEGTIQVKIENCTFLQNGVAADSMIGNIYMDDPFGIATITSINNQFLMNAAKAGSTLVHLSGYRVHDYNAIDLTSNLQDIIINCTFSNNTASDTGNIIIHNADLTFLSSTCDANTVGLDGSCIAAYSSTLDIADALISNTITQVSGAIYSDLSVLRIQDAEFTNNVAKYGDGSCIYAKRMIPIIMGDCPPSTFDDLYDEFSQNETAHEHYLFSVYQCLFHANRAYNGSGGAIYIGTDYDTRLLNTTCLELAEYIYEDEFTQNGRRLLQLNDTISIAPTLSPTESPNTPSPTAVGCIAINIDADIHLSDISWQIRGLDHNGSYTKFNVNNSGVPSYCIPNVYNDTCLEFRITDSFGDGLSYGEGIWSIEWLDEAWISPSAGNYYDEEILEFCLSYVYEEEEPAVIDVVVSISDDTDSLDFVMAFVDDIAPRFDNRIVSNLVFTKIGNREIASYLFANSAEMCINNADELPVYCSDYGNEAIINALAILCIWSNPANDTLFDEFTDYWGDANTSSNSGSVSDAFNFLQTDCDLVDLQQIDGEYMLISGMELLNKSFQLFDDNYDEDDLIVPQIAGVPLTASDSWTAIWDADTQTICEFYNANPDVIELLCDTIAFNVAIKPTICQYESCRSTRCSADEAIIVYHSESQRFFQEDAESIAFDTGPDAYEIMDLDYVMVGEFSLEVQCFGNYVINETLIANKGVLVFTNNTCDYHSFVLRLQNAGARAVIIGEDVAISYTLSPTQSPTLAPTTTEEDRLYVVLNATLNGLNMTQFEQKKNTLIAIINETLSASTQIAHYNTFGSAIDKIKMILLLDVTEAYELWESLRSDASEMYLELLKWSVQLGVEDLIHTDATFAFVSTSNLQFQRIEPTPRPTPEPTTIPTPAPTAQSIYIPVRVLDGATGRKFAEIAYFMSILNYTNDDPYIAVNESAANQTVVPGINDLKVSFMCNITLPTPQPTPAPTEPQLSLNDTKTYLSDEISIYGFNSYISDNALHAQPQWIVSLPEYVLNATCNFVDLTNDALDVNDTSKCKPRLDHLYDKCLMEVGLEEDGTEIESRSAQIDTITFDVNRLCIYMNIGQNPGFLVPDIDDDDVIDLNYGEESVLPLIFEEGSAGSNLSRPCASKYKQGNGLITIHNMRKGTYCFFIDENEDKYGYHLTIKPVYRWIKPFMQIYDSIFDENIARKNGGAVVIAAESGSIGDYSSMIIKDSFFSNNNASRGSGGAIYKSSAVDDTIDNIMSILILDNITENRLNQAGSYGGSVAVISPEFSNIWRGAVLMTNLQFEDNFAGSYGGAIYAEWSNLYIFECIFNRNEVLKSGGAIYLKDTGFGVLDSEFQFNIAINISSDDDNTRDKDVRFEYDNDGGAVFSSFYNEQYSNPACVGFYNIYLYNNTAGNVGGALWLGLHGNEAKRGLSCIKLSNIKFGNATYRDGTANRAYDGGRAIFLNVSSGTHPILFGETSVTQLCFSESNICKQFESTVYHMCVQPYEVAAGVCNVNISFQIEQQSVDWVDDIHSLSLAGNEYIEMFPGDSKMFQVFGWDVYGNKLSPNEWGIDVSTKSEVIDLTETIESPVRDSWLFPLFTQAATVGDEGSGKIYDLNGVATDLIINIRIVNCSDGYTYRCLNCEELEDSTSDEEEAVIYTCLGCVAGSYIMNSNPCIICPLGLECLGTNNVKVAQYWYGKPQSDGKMALQLCPPGLCCNTIGGCPFHYKKGLCSMNRNATEPLCGACNDGFTETSSASGACGICPKHSPIIFLLPALLGFLLVLFYLRKLSQAKQDIPHPMQAYIARSVLFVYQLLPTLTFQSSSAIFSPLAALSNFEIDTSNSEEERAGTCYLASLGPRDKIGVGLIPSMMFLGQLGLIYAIYFIKMRFYAPKTWLPKDKRKWDLAFYQTFWQLCIMLYAKVTISLLKLTDCRQLGTEFGTVMWYAGSIPCWDVFHGFAWFGLALMFLTPFLVVYILRREYLRHPGNGWKYLRRKYPALVMPYRRQRYWYAAWNLARRFILIGIASLPTQRPDISASSLSVVVGFVLGFHIYYRPFYHEINNKLESFSLGCALAISILNIMLEKPLFFGTLTAIFAFAPLVPIPFLMYQFAIDKIPIEMTIVKKEQSISDEMDVDQLFGRRDYGFGAKTIKQKKQDDWLRAKSTRIQQKKQDLAWKTVKLPGGITMHAIKKRDLLDEDGVDAFSKKNSHSRQTFRTRTQEEKDEFYPSEDDRSWSGISELSYTKDEDFLNEELDERTLWQVLTGKKIEKYDEDDWEESEEEEQDTKNDESDEEESLKTNEIRITQAQDGEEDSDDFNNDYYYNNRIETKSLFGGTIKVKQGIAEKKKLIKQQREMMQIAQKNREERKRKKKSQLKKLRAKSGLIDPFSVVSPRMKHKKDLRLHTDLARVTSANSEGGYSDMTSPQSVLTPGASPMIEMPSMRKSASYLDSVDPFEESRKVEAKKRKITRENKRRERKQKRKRAAIKEELQRKRAEEDARRTAEEKLKLAWNESQKVQSVSELDRVEPAVIKYLQDEKEEEEVKMQIMEEDLLTEEEEESESDDLPANELLDDDGAAVIQETIIKTMDIFLDVVAAALVDDVYDDDDDDLSDLIVFNIDELNDELNLQISVDSLDEREKKAIHTVLGSDLADVAAHDILRKNATPHTLKVAKEIIHQMDDDDDDDEKNEFEINMDVMEEAMDLVMEMQDDDENDDDDDSELV